MASGSDVEASQLEAGQRGPEAADPARALGPWRVLTASRSTGEVPWHLVLRRVPLLAGLALVAVLVACSSRGQAPGAGTPGGPGPGMMASAPPGYHYSRLSCSAPSSLPGHTVRVVLGDMGMTRMMGGTAPLGAHMMLHAVPNTVPAGQISFVAQNMGWRTHELVILPLADGAVAGQRVPGADGKIDETGSLGEASNSCVAGDGDGIASGAVGWTTVSLPKGRYELVCNLQNHYADGMHQELVVS